MTRFNNLLGLFLLAGITAASLFEYHHEESGLYRRTGCGTKCFTGCCGGAGPKCVCDETCDPYDVKMPGKSLCLNILIQCRMLIRNWNWSRESYSAGRLGQAEGSSKESRYWVYGFK